MPYGSPFCFVDPTKTMVSGRANSSSGATWIRRTAPRDQALSDDRRTLDDLSCAGTAWCVLMSPRMSTCPHCGVTTGPGKRHRALPNGSPCPNAGRRSVPYDQRTEAGKDGLPRYRLPLEFGELCARVVAVGLVEPASLLLKNLLRRRRKDEPE